MTVLVSDAFTGYSAPATSGAAPYTATDNVEEQAFFDFEGTPTTGDKIEWAMTFPGGTVTFVAEWTSSTTLVLKRVSTIAGTSNGTATLRTFTSTSTSKPRTDGDLVRMGFKVNRGAVNALTAITFTWHARSSFAGAAQTSDTFNVDGELTPSAATFTITGSSFRNRPNLEGRAPDTVGGGSYSWQQSIGSFKQGGTLVIERYDINGVVAEGELQPVRAADSPPIDVMYGLAGGISESAMTVRVSATCDAGQFPLMNIGAKWDIAAKTGLIAFVAFPGIVVIGSYTAGSYDGDYDSVGLGTDLDDDTEHVYEFVIDDVGLTAQVYIDGVGVFSPPVDISAGAGSLIGPGTGGVGVWRSDRTAAGLTISQFEIEDTGTVTPATDAYLISRHEFFAPNPTVITDVPTDSYPGSGSIVKHPESATDISEHASQGQIVGAGRAIYLDSGIQYSCDGVTVPLGDDYCADIVADLPARTEPGTGVAPFNEPWRYRLRLTGSGNTLVEGLVSDLLGFSGALGSMDGGTLNFSGLTVWPNGQPKSFVVEYDGPGEGEGGPSVELKFYTKGYNPGTDLTTYPLQVNWETDAGAIEVITSPDPPFGYFSNVGLTYDIGTGFYITVPMGPQNIGPDHYYPPFYFPLGNPATDGGAINSPNAVIFPTFTISTGGSLNTNATVHEISELKYNAISYTEGTAENPDAGGEYAKLEVLVRYDETTDSGYGLRFIFDHTNYPSDPIATTQLFERDNGVETRLIPDVDFSPGFHSSVQIRLCVSGTVLAASFPGGSTIGSFDYASDLADETAALVTAHDTGDPGFGGTVDQPADLAIDQFSVYEPIGCGENPPNPPCDGPGEPPGGGYPPVDTPDAFGFWVKQNGIYRFVRLPSPTEPATDVYPRSNLIHRPAQAAKVKANLKYRDLLSRTYGRPYEPPGSPGPYSDPCEQLPPTETPPDVEIGAPPDRIYFTWAIGPTQLGPLWTATLYDMGPGIVNAINQAAARGGSIIGRMGDKTKFRRNGLYAPDLMDAFIDSWAPFMAFVLAAQTAGSFACMHCADDWEVHNLWPPNGLSFYEINRIAGRIKSRYPGLRVVFRARSDQIGSTLMPNIDGLIDQTWMTDNDWTNAVQWINEELDFAQSRGWVLYVSENFYRSESGGVLSAARVYSDMTAYVDAARTHPWGGKMLGLGGWEFRGTVTGPDYLNAFAANRNDWQTVGPPS